ncbi:MAG: hypothetical protein U9Q91_00455 [Candidatus Marinimicrobia bacterium]|nr:hypothetical protein [Candidatus Neomarinimicrobiota bacterium]
MKRSIKTIILILTLLLFSSCINPPNIEFEARKILTCSANEIDLDYPYLYVAAWRDGLWRIYISDDNFDTTNIQVMDPSESFSEVYDVTAEGDDIIVSTLTRIWRSEDGGNSWVNIGNNAFLMGIDRFPNQPEKIFYDKYYYPVVYYSEDNGNTWDSTQTDIQTADSFIRINPFKEGEAWIYGIRGGTGFGTPYLFCVDSCGKYFKLEVDMQNDLHCEDGLNHVNSIAFDPDEPDNIFLCVTVPGKTIFKSTDGGYNWQETLTDSLLIIKMCNDAIISDKFYALCTDSKLYCVTDNFQIFQLLGEVTYESGGPIDMIHDPVRNLLLISETIGVKVVKLNN